MIFAVGGKVVRYKITSERLDEQCYCIYALFPPFTILDKLFGWGENKRWGWIQIHHDYSIGLAKDWIHNREEKMKHEGLGRPYIIEVIS